MKRYSMLAAYLMLAAAAFASPRKVSGELENRHDHASVDVIVQFRSSPGAAHRAKIVAHGGSVSAELPLVKSLRASVPASKLSELAADREVSYISPNRPLNNLLNNAAAAVLANYAWSIGLSGKGVGVAIIDSGIHVDNDLNASGSVATLIGPGSHVVASYNTIGGGTDDQYGHGTHVAGIIASNATASSCATCTVQFRGIAPGASLISFHALDKNGRGTDASVIDPINQAIQLKSKYNIRVPRNELRAAVATGSHLCDSGRTFLRFDKAADSSRT